MNIITTQLLASAKWPKYMKDDRIIIRFGNGYFVGKILSAGKAPRVMLDNKIEVTPKPKDIVGYAKMGLIYKKKKPIVKSKLMKYKVKYPESSRRHKISDKAVDMELRKHVKPKKDSAINIIHKRVFSGDYSIHNNSILIEDEEYTTSLYKLLPKFTGKGWKKGKFSKKEKELTITTISFLTKGNNTLKCVSVMPKYNIWGIHYIYIFLER